MNFMYLGRGGDVRVQWSGEAGKVGWWFAVLGNKIKFFEVYDIQV